MKKIKLPPEKYRKILQCLNLEDVSLGNIQCNLERSEFDKETNINISDRISYKLEDDILNIYFKFNFKAISKEKEKPALQMKANYILKYSVKGDCEITDEFFEIFKNTSVRFIIWPYFREFVYSMISRMNLPPLTLPMIKSS